MPSCAVLQPNGLYAVWSTIVDNFTLFDATIDDIVDHEVKRSHIFGKYPGGDEELIKDIRKEFEHIRESGIAWDWAPTWNECIQTLKRNKETESLEFIASLGLPLKMKNNISSLKREKYWHNYWRFKCSGLELKLMSLGIE